MGKCCRYAQCIGWLCLVVCSLRADPIPTLTANSASAGIGEAEGCEANLGCQFVFSASGDSFSLSGSGFSGSDYRNSVPLFPIFVPTFFGIQATPGSQFGQAAGQVILAGQTYSVQYSGTATVNAPTVLITPIGGVTASTFTVSSGDITAPPITPSSPSTMIVLPATITGSFSACLTPMFGLYCSSSSPAVADISVDLTGELTYNIDVFYIGTTPDFFNTTESFISTPVPEPSSMFLLTLAAVTVAISCWRKYSKRPENPRQLILHQERQRP
jgi:hypothetical protein